MAAIWDLDEIEEVNANCILMANLQQALTSGTQTNKAPIYDSDGSAKKAKSREELYFSNTSKMATVSKSISIPNKEFSDDTSPSVARKFLNETQLLIAQKEEVGIQLQAKEFDFMAAARDLDEIEEVSANCILMANLQQASTLDTQIRAVVSQDIMSIVQSNSVVDTSNLQTELDRTKEKLETCIIKKEKEYAVLWNNWINSFKTYREDKFVPINKVRESVRINPITVSQPHVITKKHVNSDSNGSSSKGVENTAKTRRPQPRRNTKNDRVPSAS
ncbi:hypothetical protein Tco_0330782 [Tanacetum coccineum]